MDNLWGEINTEKVVTPKSILEEQAKYLREATKKLLYADTERDIITEKSMQDSEYLVYDFLIKGKYMENFSYKLLSITHPIDLYPVIITLDKKTFKEIEKLVPDYKPYSNANTVTVNTQGQYITVLRLILQSERVKNLIKGILSLASKEVVF